MPNTGDVRPPKAPEAKPGNASWNLARETDGGYEVDPTRVQKWLGHAKLTTTLNTNEHKAAGDDAHIREATLRPPGRTAA
jgi:hypothetical protein